jgi:hypothetical protein
MTVDPKPLSGLVYTHPGTGDAYGTIRPLSPKTVILPEPGHWVTFAEDDCGNHFRVSSAGAVLFWDHETNEETPLAATWDRFCAGCAAATPVNLDPSQVKSVWLDPSLAKKLGKDVPSDGWVKRPKGPDSPK